MLVTVSGSQTKVFIPISANATDQALLLPDATKQVMIVNEGSDTLNVAFDGKSTTPTSRGVNDPTWTFNGTWTSLNLFGLPTRSAKVPANTAVFKAPLNVGLLSLTFGYVVGIGAGIIKLELSTDGGTTWKNPSDIVGVTRSDNAAGTAMNTFDCYSATDGARSLAFTLPYNGQAKWAFRVTPTGTKNASATDTQLFVQTASVTDASVLKVKPATTVVLEVQTDRINVSSPTSTTGLVVVI